MLCLHAYAGLRTVSSAGLVSVLRTKALDLADGGYNTLSILTSVAVGGYVSVTTAAAAGNTKGHRFRAQKIRAALEPLKLQWTKLHWSLEHEQQENSVGAMTTMSALPGLLGSVVLDIEASAATVFAIRLT